VISLRQTSTFQAPLEEAFEHDEESRFAPDYLPDITERLKSVKVLKYGASPVGVIDS
jgi:hypothetical protein